ncbi:MAG: hypothetical protein G01um101416_1135 [Microgenomates group bacterium Gr01-1014_16]|nr:MAG: hypothetical protein G01um101416_1135 [Microgenomates group bacterium Gr01-1014_16]
MDDVLLTLQPRGQVTLPKRFREVLKMGSGSIVKASLLGDGVMVRPIGDPFTTRPKYSRTEYKAVLRGVTQYMKKNGPLWTTEDDKLLAKLRKKDEERARRLNW